MLICGIHYFTEVEQDAAMEENSKLQVSETVKLFICDNRPIETHQLLITSLHSQ